MNHVDDDAELNQDAATADAERCGTKVFEIFPRWVFSLFTILLFPPSPSMYGYGLFLFTLYWFRRNKHRLAICMFEAFASWIHTIGRIYFSLKSKIILDTFSTEHLFMNGLNFVFPSNWIHFAHNICTCSITHWVGSVLLLLLLLWANRRNATTSIKSKQSDSVGLPNDIPLVDDERGEWVKVWKWRKHVFNDTGDYNNNNRQWHKKLERREHFESRIRIESGRLSAHRTRCGHTSQYKGKQMAN